MVISPAVTAARAYFPRGLLQPPGSFRFSADALLLAAFVLRCCLTESRSASVLDLGCGCGVVGLACVLAKSDAACLGVDIAPALVAAATANAASLGLEDRFAARRVDIASDEEAAGIPEAAFSVAAANMPYRAAGSGRLPRSPARRDALFAARETVPAFLRAARRALAPGGTLALIYPWSAREELAAALKAHGLFPRLVLPVATAGTSPSLCLVRAEKGGLAGEAAIREPLVLRGGGGAYAEAAAAFCPWLLSRPWSWPWQDERRAPPAD